ncbi:MAG: hypothetical protein J0M19_15020 [Sphingomonadales bacterium]|nr:hypothetical protein [Sphingomonadales bacterium]
MTRKTSRFAAFLASAAAFSMVATPAFAGGGWGWGGYRHRDRVDAGDVITGILILGGIAAIASAASSNNKKQRYERRDNRRYEDARYEDDRYERDDRPEWQEGTGVNAAISRCLGEVSRGAGRNAEVDSVNRDGEGWRVTGRAAGGDFSCTIDRDGRIRNVNVGGRAY